MCSAVTIERRGRDRYRERDPEVQRLSEQASASYRRAGELAKELDVTVHELHDHVELGRILTETLND